MLHAHHLVEAHEPGERARDRHGHDDRSRGPDAAVHGCCPVVAESPELVAPARAPEIEPDQGARREGQDEREIDGRTADLPAERAGDVVKLRQPRARRELTRLRRLLPRLDQDVDEEMGHERRGDEVEHDRGDDDVAAALGLQPRRHECPDRAGSGGDDNGGRDDQRRRPAACAETEESHSETAEVRLPLGADVEEPGVKRDCDGEPGEHEAGRVVQRVPDRFRASERSARQQPQRPPRILPDREHNKP